MLRKRTKIVCTIGPASSSEEKIRAMIRAGMNVARLNFSHGTHEEHAALITTLRKIAAETGEPIAILQDLQGPKIRVGDLPKEGVLLEKGATVRFTAGENDLAAMRFHISYENLHRDVRPGERILIDDGLLSANVTAVEGEDVFTEIVDGGIITSHKGVNFPDSRLSVSAISEKDKSDLAFGIAQKVDWVALSFVRSAQHIRDLRALMGGEPIRIIAKIEKREAVEAMDGIIAEVDAIMVARGDLGIEMRAEEVPIVQKHLIAKCLAAAKPVVVATQMLDSMIKNPRPTRAEVSDVANAVIDHADAVMLSGESAGGKYPVEAVTMMAAIIAETEASELDDMDVAHRKGDAGSDQVAMTEIANILARDVEVRLILVLAGDDRTARLISRYRPEMSIAFAAGDDRTCRQANLSWGLKPFTLAAPSYEAAKAHVLQAGWVKAGDRMIVVDPSAGVRLENA